MSPMMAPSMIDLLDTLRRTEAIRCSFPAGRRLSRNGALQRKGTGCGRRDKDPARAACPGTKIPIPPRQDIGHYHASMIRPAGNGRPFRLRALPQVGLAEGAKSFSISPCGRDGNGRWARPVWPYQRGSWSYRRCRAGLRRLPYVRCSGHRRKHHI